MNNSHKIYFDIKKPTLSWQDIGGYKEEKERLKELVCLPLTKYEELKKFEISIPKGVMLWGPLGTGITMLAEAAAKEAEATFIYVSGQEMLGKPEVIQEAFRAAVKHSPSVLFITDNDWLVPRAGSNYEWEQGNSRGKPPTFADKKLTEIYISEIDKLQSEENKVMLVGSCYRIDVVDQSIIKEKRRFNRKIFIHPPKKEDLSDMVNLYIKKMKIVLSDDFNMNKVVESITGYTGWDVETLCRKAVLSAFKRNESAVKHSDFLYAINTIIPWLTPAMNNKYFDIFNQDCPHHYNF
ncbi:AAA family ATPase [Candidatus Poribacteria bacterium]|nr:AAA family ATPase [Candidatus Poribacteria bacterium]